MLRRIMGAALLTGAVLFGAVAQAGAHLLALPAPGASGESESADVAAGEIGEHAVGLRHISGDDAPVPITVWYPAIGDSEDLAPATYSYGLHMLNSGTSITLATYEGVAGEGMAANTSAGPYPLVVLSHGFAITPSSYGWLAEHIAAHGFVVAAPHHEESLDPNALWRSTVQRPNDIEAVFRFFDEASGAGGELDRLVDLDRVAVVGHSYGGYTALAAAGARIDPASLNTSCAAAYRDRDPLTFLCDALLPRVDEMAQLAGFEGDPADLWPALADGSVDAAISIAGDAAMFGATGLAAVSVPVMAIGGTADIDSPFQWGTRLSYDHVSSGRKVEIALEDAGHMIFAGRCERTRRILALVPLGFCSDPGWDRERAHELIADYATAFLMAELGEDEDAVAFLARPGAGAAGISFRNEGY